MSAFSDTAFSKSAFSAFSFGASLSSGEHRLDNVFAAEGRIQRRELAAIIKREDEEIIAIVAIALEII